ncbi:MAG: hypothetical protein K0U38_01505 [Epsilonproteobacteria bacterium]|nr:hypothetical protein [Campylobacterota bacterium]
MKVGIAIPTPQFVSAQFALGNLPLIISDAKKKGYKVSLLYKSGVRTDSNRNHMLKEYLETDVDYILHIDADQIYPADIIDKLVKANVDIIGSVYFKRSKPYDPVVYVKSGNEVNPYRPVDLKGYGPHHYEVDGIGFGGMLVKMDVYRKMGDDKWMVYGKNFHNPTKDTHKETHDLVFCQTAQKYGYKIYVHNGVQCYHIAEVPIGKEDYERCRSNNA